MATARGRREVDMGSDWRDCFHGGAQLRVKSVRTECYGEISMEKEVNTLCVSRLLTLKKKIENFNEKLR